MKMVSESVAVFFFDQCDINPVLQGLLKAHDIKSKKNFVDFLRRVANRLNKEAAFPDPAPTEVGHPSISLEEDTLF